MSKPNSAYITLEPTDPRYRQVIKAALKTKDTATLEAIRGHTHKPIWFINSWFMYALMASSWDLATERTHVPIYHPRTRLDYARLDQKQQGVKFLTPCSLPIPIDTYDFLL